MRLDFIAERKRELGLTNSTLSDLSGINLSTLDKITSGTNQNPTFDTLQRLADVLECTLDDFSDKSRRSMAASSVAIKYDALDQYGQKAVNALIDIELQRVSSQNHQPVRRIHEADTVKIRRYESPAAAGQPLYAESDYVIASFPADAVPSGTDYALGIAGHSMEPLIPDKSTVFVCRSKWAHDGDIVVSWVDGEGAVCKRVKMKGSQLLKLESINPQYPDIEGSALNGFRLFGKVIGVYKSDGSSAMIPVSPMEPQSSGENGVLAFLSAQDRRRTGEILHRARLAIGATQREIGNAIGVSMWDVRSWEEDKSPIPENKIKDLARVLRLPVIVLKEL